jgi:hypothetical protein
MKRSVLVAFSIIVLSGLLLSIALVSAYQAGYENTNYAAITAPVTDGKWTTTDEWLDAMVPPNLPTTFHWREKWTQPSDIIQHFIVEAFTDSTNDTGDYLQFCYDRSANGGSAPQTDDIRLDYVGHNGSGLTLYQGNGTGWAKWTGWDASYVAVVETISSSPLNSNPHWIYEFWVDKSKAEFDISGAGYAPWIRVAVYDASNATAGVQSWPPSSVDVPSNWGLETGTTSSIPESLTIVSVVLLSSVAVVVSFYLLRKRPKTEIHSAVKTGEINCTR